MALLDRLAGLIWTREPKKAEVPGYTYFEWPYGVTKMELSDGRVLTGVPGDRVYIAVEDAFDRELRTEYEKEFRRGPEPAP